MSYYRMLEQQYGTETKQVFKQYNNANNSVERVAADEIFLLRCRSNKVFPKHIVDRTKNLIMDSNAATYKSKVDNFLYKTRKSMLNLEITLTIDRHAQNKERRQWCQQMMYRVAPNGVVNDFIIHQKAASKIGRYQIVGNHKAKVAHLCKNGYSFLKYNPKWFINLTDEPIPKECEMMLALGKKFAVNHTRKELPVFDIISDIENVTRSVREEDMHNTIRAKAATILSNHLHKKDSSMARQHLLLQKSYTATKKFLRSKPEIVIVDADKGNLTIAMDRTTYNTKMDQHFNDETKFRRLCLDPTKSLQDNNNRIVRKLLENKHIEKQLKRKLLTFTAQAPTPRATLKVHKPKMPIRIITNGTSNPAYQLSKYLNQICTRSAPKSRYNIKNSFELVSIIKLTKLQPEDTLVSFDIVSMFTMIPLSLVYKSLQKRWDTISNDTSIPWPFFKEMVKFCLADTNYVAWNGKYFRQKDGLTIGGCCSAIMADFVVTDILESVVEECGYDLTMLVKYVDDILMVVPQDEIENTLMLLNSKHKEIQFTCEIERNGRIPYLDIEIIKGNGGTLTTNFYQKPTSSNRLLNWDSAHPKIQKSSMAYGYISRVLTLSSKQYHYDNLSRIYEVLLSNGYPFQLIKSLISKFVRRKSNFVEQDDDKTAYRYKGMMYVNQLSENLRKLFIRFDPELRIGYKPSKTMDSITKIRNGIIQPGDNFGVVYSFGCNDCDGIYIGQTGQFLKNRIKQHKSDSKSKTIFTKTNTTAAVQHMLNTGHKFNFDGVKVLAKQQQLNKRLVLETLHINSQRSKSVNLKADIDNMNPVYSQVLSLNKTDR